MTRWLKYDTGTCTPLCEGCRAALLTGAQATALRELHNTRTLVGLLRPGAGKTLVSFLVPTILKAQRPLLVIPAAQRAKTEQAFAEYARHWRVLKPRIVSYEFLGHPNQIKWLEQHPPDVIVCDESHKLQDSASKCAKRLGRFKKVQLDCTFVPLTGSPGGRAIRRYWHVMRWAMGDKAPLPKDPMEVQAWAYAIDEKVPPEARYEPGALLTLAPVEGDDLEAARRAYGARLTSTPGVVSTLAEVPSVGLTVRAIVPELPGAIVDAILHLRDTMELPDGNSFLTKLELWSHARTLGCGLFRVWDPPAPEPWRHARRNWHCWVREKLGQVSKFDSIVHLVEELDRWPDGQALYSAWKSIEPSFTPVSVGKWVDTTVLDLAAEWLAREQGLVFVEQRAFGERLAKETGLPFFADGGFSACGAFIQDYRGPAIASIHACAEGLNLQHWHKTLVTSPPSTGDKWSQMLARFWRQGQKRDVSCEVVLTSRESYQCLAQAIRDAERDQAVHGQVHPLVCAEKELDTVLALVQDRTQALWAEIGV